MAMELLDLVELVTDLPEHGLIWCDRHNRRRTSRPGRVGGPLKLVREDPDLCDAPVVHHQQINAEPR
jgi:hypothetical protein